MKIVGLNFFHADTSSAIIIDNKLIAAAEEERFSRIKHFSGFPVKSLNFCLKEARLKIDDVDYISVNTNPYYNFFSKLKFSLKNLNNINIIQRIERIRLRRNINKYLYWYFGSTKKVKLNFVPHHLSHNCSSILTSGLDDGLSISFDAAGDFSTLEVYEFKQNNFIKLHSEQFPHSLGILYQSITQYLGFKDYGDEYKVMGLAAYGQPCYIKELETLFNYNQNNFRLNLEYFQHHIVGFNFNFTNDYPYFTDLYSKKLINLLGEDRKSNEKILQRHKDIACSLQVVFQKLFNEIVSYFKNKTGHKNLFLSGGCAFNALNNKYIGEKNNFEKIHIFPNSGDAGGGFGSALYTNFKKNKKYKKIKLETMYVGPKEQSNEIEKVLSKKFKNKNEIFNIEKFENKESLIKKVAQDLNNGLIIAWHQGRMEFGPRALGNRSILGNPSISNIKEIINSKIKNREDFRPFAPSILKEFADEYFILNTNLDYRFMNVICDTKKDKRNLIPGVINIDNTSRPQIVDKNDNEVYYNLIEEFYKMSKVPILLNTSLNIQEPICCSSEDTVNTFLNSGIDIMAIENFYIRRNSI